MNKLISVIMPVKDGEKYLKEAIEGIRKQNMNLEIILVNDGSTDHTAAIAEQMGCIVINHEKNQGPTVAKNTGLKHAHGDYVMFHDGDDVMNADVLQTFYDILDKDNTISAVMGKIKDFLSPDVADSTSNASSVRPDAYYGLLGGAVLMRRNVFDIIGLFDESIRAGDVIEWKNKMDSNNQPIKKLDIIASNRRIHDNNFGKTNRKTEFQDYAKILRASLLRKKP